ncbi:hypothetical protein AAG906_020807 [Vitis piasezkii]
MPSTFHPWKNEKTHLQQPKTLKHPPLCKECKLNLSKYTCPGCFVPSRSLSCVKAHKQHTGCTGKRQRTQFVPLSQFDDKLLLSDYNLLEEVKRVAKSAQRTRVNLCGHSHFKTLSHLQGLSNASQSHRTKLLFLPSGMSKSTWTIEWRFHSTYIVLLNCRVNETSTLSSIIENHLKPWPWNYKLKPFCAEQLDCFKFFIRKYLKGRSSPFHEFDIRVPIRQELVNLVILEYPLIHIFLPSHSYNVNVIKGAKPLGNRRTWWSSNPQFLNLMKHVKSIEANKLRSSPTRGNQVTFSKKVKYEERIDRSNLGRFFPVEELEEREIPGC